MLTSDCTERLLGWRTGSDRREAKPITPLAVMGRASDWLLAREFHRGPERNTLSISEAEDTTAVRSPSAIRNKITLAGGVQIQSWTAYYRYNDLIRPHEVMLVDSEPSAYASISWSL